MDLTNDLKDAIDQAAQVMARARHTGALVGAGVSVGAIVFVGDTVFVGAGTVVGWGVDVATSSLLLHATRAIADKTMSRASVIRQCVLNMAVSP